MKNQSGQALMVGSLILIVLLITIPAIIMLNGVAGRQGAGSNTRVKGRAVAEEGIAVAIQRLTVAQGLNCAAYSNFNGATKITSTQGGVFTIDCINGPETYQSTLVSRAYDNKQQPIPASAISAVVSRHTVGAKLPTGYSTSAALEMMQAPTQAGAVLAVEFGPIVIHDAAATWTLDTAAQLSRRPRKISAGCISPVGVNCSNPVPPTTDQKEYWTFTSPGFANVIDRVGYRSDAQGSTCPGTPPTCTTSANCNNTAGNNCDFFNVGVDTAVFDTGFTCVTPNCVVFVNGNAELRVTSLDLTSGANQGAFVVTGNLILGVNNDLLTGNPTVTVRVPPTAKLDDPRSTAILSSPPWNGTSTRKIDLRGFVYVGGNLTVATNTFWTINGVMRVDGATGLLGMANLHLYYNDLVNHGIRTTQYELQIDSSTAVQ